MKLVVGLGNPGEKYKNNRHNVGFQFVDYLIKNLQIQNSELIIVKPQTFMNFSGQAVKKIIENCKLKIENLIVVHDDLDIPLGKFKIGVGVGPQLHNGLASIEQSLRTKDFWRVRIGVDNRDPDNRIPGESYVLQNFTEQEQKIVANTFPAILRRIKADLLPII